MKYPLFKVNTNNDLILENIKEVLESGFINEGEQVNKLKEKLRDYLNHKNVILTNSCTSALDLALTLSGVGPGDEVITTSMTCVATNTPVLNKGAKVVWADINEKTGNIDPYGIVSSITHKTKAIMCVDWAGSPCDFEEIHKIANRFGIKVVQDAAHAFGAKYKGKHVCHYADYTCYSFQAIKHMTCGDGGALVCNRDYDFEIANQLKWFGFDRDKAKDEKGNWKGQRWEADIDRAGFKYNMNNISAAIGLANLEVFDPVLKKFQDNASVYNELFKDCKFAKPLKVLEEAESSYWVYTILLDEKYSKQRDEIMKSLNDRGVGASLVHIPNHDYSCFSDSWTYLEGVVNFSKKQLSLPCGSWLSEDDIRDIFKIFNEVCEQCM